MPRFNPKAALKRLVITALCIYLALLFLLWWYQRSLLYFPDTRIESPAAYQLADFEDGRVEIPGTGFVQV